MRARPKYKSSMSSRVMSMVGIVMALSLLFVLSPTGPNIRSSGGIPVATSDDDSTPKLSAKDIESTKAYPDVSEDVDEDEITPDLGEVSQQEIVDRAEAEAETETTPPSIFQDEQEFRNAPNIRIDDMQLRKKLHVRQLVSEHRDFYKSSPRKLYVPRLRSDVKLSNQEFVRRFVLNSQPVIIPFDAMRHLGFEMKAHTLDELLEVYPNHGKKIYKFGVHETREELDLGPGLSVLKKHDPLKFTKTGRNFPRNTKVRYRSALSKLGLQAPPYRVPDTGLLSPALWFGTEDQPTVFHSDCCDNYAFMIMGTKRWTVSPPSEALVLRPDCKGGLCWVKNLPHPDEHAETAAEKKLAANVQSVTFELRPGEMLYLPTGWFHHVENLAATIMVNYWTKGGPGFQRAMRGEFDTWLNEEDPDAAKTMEDSLDEFSKTHDSQTSSALEEEEEEQEENDAEMTSSDTKY